MIVQWCIKGLGLDNDQVARDIIDQGSGLMCNWWREVGRISPQDITAKLTLTNLDRHVNHFTDVDPSTTRPFNELSPFISLSAGTIQRDSFAKTNHQHRARRVAFWFATDFGRRSVGYLFTCWTVLAPRSAVDVESMAEEVRDLNTYRRYSAYQAEGEILAKVHVPANQILSCGKWTLDSSGRFVNAWTCPNPGFVTPDVLSNVRGMI